LTISAYADASQIAAMLAIDKKQQQSGIAATIFIEDKTSSNINQLAATYLLFT